MYRLTHDQVIDVTGDDAQSWLSGQVTQDINQLKSGQAVYALVVEVKGRIVSDLWVVSRGEAGLRLIVPASTQQTLLSTFDKYIIMEDVTLTQRPELSVVFALGWQQDNVLPDGAEMFACDLLGTGDGVGFVMPGNQVELLQPVVSDEQWQTLRMTHSIPEFGIDFDAHNYAQEAGLHHRAVSFNKGCYTGQEVVCMLEMRGQLTRRLVRLEVACETLPVSGNPISADDKPIGHITTVVASPSDLGKVLAFGYVKRAFAEPGAEVRVEGGTARVTGVVGEAMHS